MVSKNRQSSYSLGTYSMVGGWGAEGGGTRECVLAWMDMDVGN